MAIPPHVGGGVWIAIVLKTANGSSCSGRVLRTAVPHYRCAPASAFALVRNSYRQGGLYACDRACGKPAAAEVGVKLMRRSRLPAILASLVAVAIAAGGAYWFSSSSTQRAAVQSKKSSQSGQRGGAVPVVTQLVTVAEFPIRRRTIGILESPATVIIRSRIDSQVLEQHMTDGDIVKKGDLLFTLDDREIKATIARDEATIAKDQAALTQADAALRRTQELISKNVAPQQQLEQATAAYKAAQQTVEADQAVLQADQLRLGYAEGSHHRAYWRHSRGAWQPGLSQ
jgi:Biotin-lipoyl like